MFASPLVYNHKRTGEFTLDGRRFLLRRVPFPENPPPEWFVVDLLQHHDMAGISLVDLADRLVATLRENRWNRNRLQAMAERFATKATAALVERCLLPLALDEAVQEGQPKSGDLLCLAAFGSGFTWGAALIRW